MSNLSRGFSLFSSSSPTLIPIPWKGIFPELLYACSLKTHRLSNTRSRLECEFFYLYPAIQNLLQLKHVTQDTGQHKAAEQQAIKITATVIALLVATKSFKYHPGTYMS